jgi:pyridoxal phosphate enzyme (YggS family)
MENIRKIIDSCSNATIVAATKYVDETKMNELLGYGINHFGENRVNDFLRKYEVLNGLDIVWHFIGSLQTNKVKSMINKISYLHSLNSYKLATFIEKYRIEPLKCFLEINLTESSSKTGINVNEVKEFLLDIKDLSKVNVIGLMTMTEKEQTDDEKLEVFNKLNSLKNELNELGYNNITELSMGMSDDYLLAIKANASFVRLGRILFR